MGFFDKLGMGIEEKKINEARPAKKTKKENKPKSVRAKIEPAIEKPATPEDHPLAKIAPKKDDFEGELAIDVYETDGDFVIQSTIAGVKSGDLDISIENDIVTIRGNREKQAIESVKKHYYQECYWGAFSRQVILPEEVDGSKAEASIKEGVLTLRIPKSAKIQKRKIAIKQED